MSFLGDLVNSIGTGAAPPPKTTVRSVSATSQQHVPLAFKSGSRPSSTALPSPLNGTKRKAEDEHSKPPAKVIRPNPAPGLTSTVSKRPAAPPLNAPKSSNDKAVLVPKPKLEPNGTASKAGSTSPSISATAAPKAPPKGSYADIMARAKQAQETKAQSQIGLIKHQATNRERVSKVAERRRQEEEKAKAAKATPGARPALGKQGMSRSASPAKKTDQPRVPKAPRPPLHAPASYKGTIGTAATRPRQQDRRRRNKYDEYLGTDEEDASEGSYGRGEEDDYESDASSVMEAGAFEVDEEEQRALRAAREEDARELALEAQLKREKEERRRRLMNLASKRK
ncbi:hypothetical protein A1O1_05100 [Capronia coronata CBS 617.96]|uniref:SPT2 chromatin protein n=1 Tax=Capronia coronata CBS 617.96 TaxID=1182541 RepID=W9Y5R2_9EURO|nr:uncharacterized protein A1O1_05100 [Capronia coronata CBS 617.96]EXJ88172.1 hypothetical protein A1O1_05100 [Capronia coronata CBS 617.96]